MVRCHVILLLLIASGLRGADTLETFEAELAKSWNTVTSLSYTVETVVVLNRDDVLVITNSISSVEQIRKGDRWLVRSETRSLSSTKPGNNESRFNALLVYDGELLHSLFEHKVGEKKRCVVMKVDKGWSNAYDSLDTYKGLKAKMNLKILPDDVVEDVPVFVIESTPRVANANAGRNLFSKQTGLWMGGDSKSPDGTSKAEIKVKNMKFNVEIAAERFSFTPPPGVPVENKTEDLKDVQNRK
jgi:outer membrane lipoprotein-sorting protein